MVVVVYVCVCGGGRGDLKIKSLSRQRFRDILWITVQFECRPLSAGLSQLVE